MKKLVFSTVVIFAMALSHSLSAQKFNIGANGALAIPLGDAADLLDIGFGGDLSANYYFNDKVDIGVEVGFRSFANDADVAYHIIPLQLTGAYHQDIDDFMDLYGELGVGLFMFTGDIDSESFFGLSPRVGAAFELTPELFLDVNVNFNTIFPNDDFGSDGNFNYLGVNLGILYTLSEF